VVEGYPRIDLTLNADQEDVKRNLSNVVNVDFNKKIILYAPTWRGQVHSVQDTEQKITSIINELVTKIPPEYQLLLKVHTLTYQSIKDNEALKRICIPDWVDTNELLAVVDILVTDYSSIFFDYLVTKKPIVFFMYDRSLYEEDRGLYLDLDTLPGPICNTIIEVISAIKNVNAEEHKAKYQEMVNKYSYLDDGLSTKRHIDIIFHSKRTNSVYKVNNRKKNILFYCGGFLNNGITTSAINLLNHIDYENYNVAVIDKGKYDEVSTQNVTKLNKKVKRFFRVGGLNQTITEYYLNHYIVRRGLRNPMLHKFIPVSLYKREFLRLFGDAKFDIVVDFSGYVPFWSLLFAFGDFKRKNIYQHNDMMAEYHKKINGKWKHRGKMNVIFPLYQYFDKVVSVAEYTRDLNVENLKEYITREKAVFVHNCIDPEKVLTQMEIRGVTELPGVNNSLDGGKLNTNGLIMPKKENVNFVTMGRLSPEKDHQKLIHAFAKTAQLHKNVRLYIVGEGVLDVELKDLSLTLGLGEKVIFTGQLSNPFYLINQCDCFVLSSNHEGQPMVLLEALIVGIPIISTDIAGSRSILKGGYGELVDNSVDGLSSGMERFIAGKIPVKEFHYEQYIEEALRMFYQEVCH
jgi:CDP-glycerol glycerophosphotransferase